MNPKLPSWYGNNLSKVLEPQAGMIFYLHGTNGLDTNDGRTPNTPFLTLTYALSQCVNARNDYIIVLYYPSAGAVGETWPINVDKGNVHIVGSDFYTNAVRIFRAPTDTAVFEVNASGVEIAGFLIEGMAAGGSTHGGIETDDAAQTASRLHVHHCDFGWQTPLQDGIMMPAGFDVPHCLIHHNRFNDKITRDGIRISQNACRGEIWANEFRLVGGIGIHLESLCTDIYAIHDNVFRVADSATGEAITCNAASTMCMFWGNQTMEGNVAMGSVPYRDLGANHWGLNYYGLLAIMPVTV